LLGLPDGEKTLSMCKTVYAQYRRVTDRQTDARTDGQTSWHGIVRAMHTRRAVKSQITNLILSSQSKVCCAWQKVPETSYIVVCVCACVCV